jgi:hypothetical protein
MAPPPTLALTFLAPAAGIIAGAITVPLLLLLYFLRLRRRPVRISSTLLWEQAVQDLQVNAPFRMIRFSWLLVLQLLALLCLLLAVARPAIDLPSFGSDRVILLIDRSASMRATDASGGRTRLEEAKARALELVDRLGGGETRIMVVEFASTARAVLNFSRDRGAVRNAIDAIQQTDQPDDLAGALRVVEAFALGGEDGEESPPRVVLLSDGDLARSAQPVSAMVGAASVEFVRTGPSEAAERDNAGLVALSARRDFEDPATVRVFARVISTLPRELAVSVRFELDGETTDLQSVTIPPAAVDGPGELSVTSTLQSVEGGVLVASISRSDALDSDDAAALVLQPPGRLSILIVREQAASDAADFALEDAFEALEPRELRTMLASDYAQQATMPGFFDDVDLIVFDRVLPAALPPTPSLSFGATVPIPGVALEPTEQRVAEIAFWQRSHPVMRYVGLNAVTIGSPGVIRTPEARADLRAEVLASGTDGPLIVQLENRGVRRVLVGFPLQNTNWWRDLSFPVFIANVVDALTLSGEESSGTAFSTREAVIVRAPDGVESLELVAPDGSERSITVGDRARVNLGTLSTAGLYALGNVRGPSGTVAVNVFNEHESRIGTRDVVEIAGRDVRARGVAGMAPREIWPWLVAAAFVLLMLEWVFFAWRMRV